MSRQKFDTDKREKDDVLFVNRRADPRHNVEIGVEFEVSNDGPHTFFTGLTQDISKGGIFLATHQIYPVGTGIDLSFIIDGGQYNVKAVVRWIRQPESISNADMLPGMGLQFIDPGKDLIEVFDRFLMEKDPLMVDVE